MLGRAFTNLPAAPPARRRLSLAAGTQFAKANVVYLKYCTSDGYIGDAAASAATGNMAFRGRQVVAATIAALRTNHGFGASTTTVVRGNASVRVSQPPPVMIYSGCSAGGMSTLLTSVAGRYPMGLRRRAVRAAPTLACAVVPFPVLRPGSCADRCVLGGQCWVLGDVCPNQHPIPQAAA